jgi:hypothetical protein
VGFLDFAPVGFLGRVLDERRTPSTIIAIVPSSSEDLCSLTLDHAPARKSAGNFKARMAETISVWKVSTLSKNRGK